MRILYIHIRHSIQFSPAGEELCRSEGFGESFRLVDTIPSGCLPSDIVPTYRFTVVYTRLHPLKPCPIDFEFADGGLQLGSPPGPGSRCSVLAYSQRNWNCAWRPSASHSWSLSSVFARSAHTLAPPCFPFCSYQSREVACRDESLRVKAHLAPGGTGCILCHSQLPAAF